MKKLLVLTFILLVATMASADPGNMLFFVGTEDGVTPLSVGADKWVNVDVWFQCDGDTIYGGNVCFPLGINNCYVDAFDGASCAYYYPYTQWDSRSFGNLNEDFQEVSGCTWDSYTFAGWAWISNYTNPLMHSVTPLKGFTFAVHTLLADTLYLGSTIADCVGAGLDPMQGVANCGDSTGNYSYNCVIAYAPWFFSPNAQCEIIATAIGDVCTYEDYTYTFDVYDPDGDPVTVTSTLGTPVLTGSEVSGDGILWHYQLAFTVEEYCGQCLSGPITITATDGINEDPPSFEVGTFAFIGAITASMNDSLPVIPGYEATMPVYLDVCGNCFCIGGFVFTITYDASIISITGVDQGAAIVGGDYWHVTYDVDGEGTFRVTFLNDMNDQIDNEDICGLQTDPIFTFDFLVAAGDYQGINFCSPVCFLGDGPTYNAVSDPTGYTIWQNDGCGTNPDSTVNGTLWLNLECGNVKVISDCSSILGDLNLNDAAYEVGDINVLVGYLIDPVANPLNNVQMYASDVNQDGYQASIADLIYLIRVVTGVADPLGKIAPLNTIATVAVPSEVNGEFQVSINSDATIGGALVEVNHSGVELGVPTANGMEVDYSDNGEVMTVLVYSLEGAVVNAGSSTLFTVPVNGEGNVSLGTVSVADYRGALLEGRAEVTAPIPTEFSVSQNYPNPFNAKTSFSFGIPTEANVNVNIYNVAGQLVESMNLGHMAAGNHSVNWDASDVASGVYFYNVSADNYNQTMKMTLLK